MDHVIDVADRERFKRCRRAWDLGSPLRQDLEPVAPVRPVDLHAALRAALAAYYYPAMWAWDRELVRPIALRTFTRAIATQQAAAPSTPPEAWDRATALGTAVLDAYFAWAPDADDFTAVRVSDEISVVVPAPDHPGDGLLGPDGGGIRLRATVELVVADEHDRLWVVEHRFVETGDEGQPAWAEPELLHLDDRGGTLCWALELHHVAKVAGVLFNEISVGDRPAFRRTHVRKPPRELRQLRRQAADELRTLVDPTVAIYPTPSPEHCRACEFRAPCLALSAGQDCRPILGAHYRPRVPVVIPLPERTGSLGPQRVVGWKTRGPGTSSLDALRQQE